MIYYIKGPVIERHPTYLVLEANGIGYQVFISLNTYSQLEGLREAKVLTHFIVKEDGHYLYGFATEQERQLFGLLISVSGVGPNTARLILSSMEPESIQSAIALKDDQVFRKIKGVGPKTAQRIIIDLYDKVGKELSGAGPAGLSPRSTIQSEAVSALLALGFSRPAVEQVFKAMPETAQPGITVEELIKLALKKLA
ncbi:MAG TPA: Holliday junction branch migration protein RuvA [Saprospiraceae bacterium]|nr:Holliday junction branch migration protein RuvA [Saprospiraceae bacterium]